MGTGSVKRIAKCAEPQGLTVYRAAHPRQTWEQMRADAAGEQVYKAVKGLAESDQGGLCAYCEISLGDGLDPRRCRVEHFHPKADTSSAHNWALDWYNMLAVCMGGSLKHDVAPHTLEPLNENLSCDASKDKAIQLGKLNEACEGWILNPLLLPAMPSLFSVARSTGQLSPASDCNQVVIEGNQHADTRLLVQHTIDMLNLNCDRLCSARLKVIWDIERNKKRLRDKGLPPAQGLYELADRYFRQNWPVFFTTIRFCLDGAAERYLANKNFQG